MDLEQPAPCLVLVLLSCIRASRAGDDGIRSREAPFHTAFAHVWVNLRSGYLCCITHSRWQVLLRTSTGEWDNSSVCCRTVPTDTVTIRTGHTSTRLMFAPWGKTSGSPLVHLQPPPQPEGPNQSDPFGPWSHTSSTQEPPPFVFRVNLRTLLESAPNQSTHDLPPLSYPESAPNNPLTAPPLTRPT